MRVRCSVCGKPFEAQRPTAKYCGSTCRVRQSRKAKPAPDPASETPVVTPIKPLETVEDSLVTAVKADLEAAGRLETALGRQALRLAERMGSAFDTGSAIAALSRELRAVMAEALSGGEKAGDSLDELAARRVKKAAGA
jgi:hypothetical protein